MSRSRHCWLPGDQDNEGISQTALIRLLTHINDAFVILESFPHRCVDSQVTISVDLKPKTRTFIAIVTNNTILYDIVLRSICISCHYCHTTRLIWDKSVVDLQWDLPSILSATIHVSKLLAANAYVQYLPQLLSSHPQTAAHYH